MKKSDLRTMGFGKLDEDGVERFDAALGEVFEETAESDKIITLSRGGEAMATLIFDTI